MTQFRRYDKIKTYGHRECEGIDIGRVYVFPKLDGANAQIWLDENGTLWWGSRNRPVGCLKDDVETEVLDDLQGLGHWVHAHSSQLLDFFETFPNTRIYGEWLVKHTLGTYRKDAWRKFYAFDVFDDELGRFVKYDVWESHYYGDLDLPTVHPLAIFSNPTEGQLRHQVDVNTFLIEDGAGLGEGIVVKNFDWVSVNGEQPWMKIVRNEFKEENRREFGTVEIGGEFQVEVAAVEKYVTAEAVGKCRAKILMDIDCREKIGLIDPTNWQQIIQEDFRGEIIPRLLETVFHDLIEDNMWEIIKEHKNPVIDFKRLRAQSIAQTKKLAMDLF